MKNTSKRTLAIAGVGITAVALLAGTATAASQITSRQLADGAATSRVIRDDTIRARDLNDRVRTKLNEAGTPGPQGPQGPAGPSGDSHNVYVQSLGTTFTVPASDADGIKVTGEGAQFGTFANGGACDNPGTDYARLAFHGLDGMRLKDVDQLDYTGWTTSSDNTSGVASLTLRITTDHAGDNGYPFNKFVFSPNTQPGADQNADTRGQVKTYLTTLGTWRLNDDAGNGPDSPWAHFVAQNGTETITKVDILLGCQAGMDLTGVVRSVQANGTNYVLGKIG